jgi:hypothetical protein
MKTFRRISWALLVGAIVYVALLCGGKIHAQTNAVTWVPIASEGQYQGTSPVVSLPVGTVYTFGLTTKGGVICDPITIGQNPLTVVVYVSSFVKTCAVNGVLTSDPDPGKIKTLYVEATGAQQSGTYTVPPSTTPIPWSVPVLTGTVVPPVTPPSTTPVVYTCSQSVTLTFGGTPVTITNTFSAISLSGSPVTSQTAGISCVVQP